MVMSTLFTFQIIGLVIGFSAAYWLLITAGSQDDRLKGIGEILGWILIAATVILAIFNLFYSIAVANNYISEESYPITLPTQDQQLRQTAPAAPEVQEDGASENPDQEPQGGGTPIKSNIQDHE